jgi:hypothetical protein
VETVECQVYVNTVLTIAELKLILDSSVSPCVDGDSSAQPWDIFIDIRLNVAVL